MHRLSKGIGAQMGYVTDCRSARAVRTRVLIAAALALATTQLTAVDEAVSQAETDPPAPQLEFLPGGGIGQGEEVVSARTEFSQTYGTDMPGVYRTVQSAAPMNYQDESGDWQQIDTTLAIAASDQLAPAATANAITIADSASAPEIATVETNGGGSIGFGLSGAADVSAVVDDATVTFDDAAPETTLEITALASGVKEAIVLDSTDAPTHFDFPLQLEGVVPELDADGGIVYRDGAGSVVARTPAGFMNDSAAGAAGTGARSDGVEYVLDETAEGWTLGVDLDSPWLQDPARVYPVVVDPTTYTEPLSSLAPDLDDTYVIQGGSATDRSSESVLKVGYNGSAIHRSFLHFSELDAFVGMNIFDATLKLTQTGATSCSGPTAFEAYRVPETWEGDAVTSYPGPGADLLPPDQLPPANTTVGYGGSGGCSASGTASIVLTPGVWNWTEDAWLNEGLLLKAVNETATSGYRQFASADDATNPPTLELIWSDPTAGGTDSPVRPTQQAPAGPMGTNQPTLSALYSDAQSDSGHVAYFVYNKANYYWGFASGSVVSSGTNSTMTVPSTSPLPTDLPLVVRAVAQEGSPTTSGPPAPHSTMTPPVQISVPSAVLTSPTNGATISGNVTRDCRAAG